MVKFSSPGGTAHLLGGFETLAGTGASDNMKVQRVFSEVPVMPNIIDRIQNENLTTSSAAMAGKGQPGAASARIKFVALWFIEKSRPQQTEQHRLKTFYTWQEQLYQKDIHRTASHALQESETLCWCPTSIGSMGAAEHCPAILLHSILKPR